MKDLKKVAFWFILCLVLAAYIKMSGLAPVKMGQNAPAVLGNQAEKNPPRGGFGKLVLDKQLQKPSQ